MKSNESNIERSLDVKRLSPKEFAIKYYGSYPEGTIYKKQYDFFQLSFQDFLLKYYKNASLDRWNYILDKFVQPPFDESKRKEYLQFIHQVKPPFIPDFDAWDRFWEKIKDDARFDVELKKFFTFLFASGFYKNFSFEEWLSMNNWLHPWYVNQNDEIVVKNIKELIGYDYGFNYFKMLLSDMPWFKI